MRGVGTGGMRRFSDPRDCVGCPVSHGSGLVPGVMDDATTTWRF
jgi:hypothetical protein